jgi:ATP-dependent Zn protease
MAMEFTDEELAYHEAGHSVLHVLLGGTVTRVSIVRVDPHRGVHVPDAADPLPTDLVSVHNLIVVLLGGEAALHVWRAASLRRPDAKDRARAEALAAKISDEPASVLEADWQTAVSTLGGAENWSRVERLANRLATERVLDGDEVHRVIHD